MAEKKKTNLAEIAEKLTPDHVAEHVTAEDREAKREYKLEKGKVDSFDEFKEEVVKYVQHHMSYVSKGVAPNEKDALSKAIKLLNSQFEEQGGWQYAIREAMKPEGLTKIIDALHEAFVREKETDHTTYVLHGELDPHDFEQNVDFAEEYISKFGNYLPPELKKKKPEELAHMIPQLAQTHAQIYQLIRDQLGKKEKKAEYKKKA